MFVLASQQFNLLSLNALHFFSPLFSNQIIGNQGKEKSCQKTSINGINRNYSEHVKSIEAKNNSIQISWKYNNKKKPLASAQMNAIRKQKKSLTEKYVQEKV